MCNATWSSQYLVFLLNSSVNFTISSDEICQVATQQRSIIEIHSDSCIQLANITCVYNDTLQTFQRPRRGLIFFNSQVTLTQLVIKNCGTYLTTIQDSTITDYLNSSPLYFFIKTQKTLNSKANIRSINNNTRFIMRIK